VFRTVIQLKIVTKKIEWMAGIGIARMPKDSVQKKLKIEKFITFWIYELKYLFYMYI